MDDPSTKKKSLIATNKGGDGYLGYGFGHTPPVTSPTPRLGADASPVSRSPLKSSWNIKFKPFHKITQFWRNCNCIHRRIMKLVFTQENNQKKSSIKWLKRYAANRRGVRGWKGSEGVTGRVCLKPYPKKKKKKPRKRREKGCIIVLQMHRCAF